MKKKSKIIFYSILSAVLLSLFIFTVIERRTTKKEVEAVVDKMIERTPLDLRILDPDMSILKQQLYELKKVYSDYSYEQLLELLDTTESEEEYYRLLERGKGKISYPMIVGAVILVAVCGGMIGFKETEKIRIKQRRNLT